MTLLLIHRGVFTGCLLAIPDELCRREPLVVECELTLIIYG